MEDELYEYGLNLMSILREKRLPELTEQIKEVEKLNAWYNGKPPRLPLPAKSGPDHRALAEMAQDPWLRLGITTIAQGFRVERFRDAKGHAHAVWRVWDESHMGTKERILYESALAFGHSYEVAEKTPDTPSGYRINVYSPAQMTAWFIDPINDEKPTLALRTATGFAGQRYFWLYTDQYIIHYVKYAADNWDLLSVEEHGFDEIPVHRHVNIMDPLLGIPIGEIAPNIPAAKRINKTTYDLLLTQHFNSWKVRVIIGMDPPDDEINPETGEIVRTSEQILEDERARIRQSDILTIPASDKQGEALPTVTTLPETPLDGLLKAQTQQIKQLSAAMQASSPAMLGDLINLSAETLGVAETEQRRKIEARQASWGVGHERILRMIARAMGESVDGTERIVWRAVDQNSIAQVVDALGKAATMLKVPGRALWEHIPGMTVEDVERFERIFKEDDLQGALLRQQMGLLEAGDTGEHVIGGDS